MRTKITVVCSAIIALFPYASFADFDPTTFIQDQLTTHQEQINTIIKTYTGKELDMPPKDIELLFFLASHPNKVFTREQLLEQVWGFEYFGDSRTVDVHIKRIREKMPVSEGWSIKTVWGIGYKFEVKDQNS